MVFGKNSGGITTTDSESGKVSTYSANMKEKKTLKNTKPPSYISEIAFLMINMLLLKFYSERFYDAMTFFNISVPIMAFLICSLFMNLMEFVKLLHIEEMTDSGASDALISPK